MSLTSGGFEVGLPIAAIDSGTSVLLTGDDTDVLKQVFASLTAAQEGERSVVLATESGGRSIRQTLAESQHEAGERSSILTCEGPGRGEDVETVDDLGDLTQLGMQFSNLVATSQQSTERFRSGIFLCSTICSEVDDTRSVYRFLNTNFLTELRRGEGMGVCALDTGADLETDVDSMIAGMERSFDARIDVEKTGHSEAHLTTDGLAGVDEEVEISL